MFKCLICQKEFEKSRSLGGHLTKHSRSDKDIFYPIHKSDFNLIVNGLNCKFCGRISKSKNSLKQHEIRCKQNPQRKQNIVFENYTRLHIKPTNNKIYKCRFCKEEFQNSCVLGAHAVLCHNNPNYLKNLEKFKNCKSFLGKTHTQESRKKISIKAKEGIKNGTWRTFDSWVGLYEYNSIIAGKVFLMGTWEVEYAKYLDLNNIQWIWNHKRFYYESIHHPTKFGYYKPDFYLVVEDSYVEVKGYETELDHDKWKFFPHKLKVLRYDDLKKLGINIK